MEIIIYILIGLVAIVTVCICYTIVKDSIKERKEEKLEKENKEIAKEKIESKISKEEIKENLVPASDVSFDIKNKTLEEKYLSLSSKQKEYYDEIVKVAMAVTNSKRIKNENYEDYKLGNNRLVRLKIKKECVIAELLIPNLSYKIASGSIKQGASIVKVVDDNALNSVKDGIAFILKTIEEEKAYKKEKAKEKRNQAKQNIKDSN